ncbi:hypothetical protein CEXT_163991 [Caerostris extrusa]|uniref:C2H2-type domain-containing protein n=1 Tax=Caerostris extrusa TaxID=172846 RepID=A0AAV4T5A7_CAEEX|nr:hypothetical protein CEXT_163991 [Caerostris extrusa]
MTTGLTLVLTHTREEPHACTLYGESSVSNLHGHLHSQWHCYQCYKKLKRHQMEAHVTCTHTSMPSDQRI